VSVRNVPPQLTLDHVSPATRLLEKRRQKIEVQEALEAQKADFARREEQFQRREQIIKKKDLELQENLIRFNKFLQENDTKRTRAEKKFVEEERKKEEHTKAIEVHKIELEELQAALQRDLEELTRVQKYQQYLEQTAESTGDEFGEPLDLKNRYDTLADKFKTLGKQETENEELKTHLNDEVNGFVKRKKTKHVENTKRLWNMTNEYEALKMLVAKREMEVEKEESEKMTMRHLIGQVRMSVENTFARCVRQTSIKSKADKYDGQQDIMEQLDFIAEYYIDLKGITKAFADQKKEERKQRDQELANVY